MEHSAAIGLGGGVATLVRVSTDDRDIDGGSLDAFLAGVEKRAFRIAQIATRDRDEALDIVQDAMLKLTRSYAQRAPAEWPPLFYRILDNTIRDWQRHQSVRRRLLFWRDDARDGEESDPVQLLPDPEAHGDALLQRHEALGVLEAALRGLPARQRQAFELRLWHGLSVEESARAMGCSAGSVKTHLFRALQALRARLQGVWP
jgi:RNA polymerase sigma-70 factor (ECF subfamily)